MHANTYSDTPSKRAIHAKQIKQAKRIRTLMAVLLFGAFASLLVVLGTALKDPNASGPIFLALISINLIFVTIFAGYIVYRFIHLLIERRRGLMGTRLHLRLMGIFSTFALAPVILVGVSATWILNQGVESWFSTRVSVAINGSLRVAEAYYKEHENNLLLTVNAIASDPVLSYPTILLDKEMLENVLKNERRERFLADIAVYDDDGQLLAQSGNFVGDVLSEELRAYMKKPYHGGMVLRDETDQRLRVITQLGDDYFLVAAKWMDPSVLARMDQTKEAFDEYELMREERDSVRFIFMLSLLVLAVGVLAISVWVGLKLAQRISKPVIALVQATNKISQGDLSVRLTPLDDDELGVLTQSFNRMANQMKDKQSLLESKNKELDDRRRTTEAVLSGVRAGVMSFDDSGTVVMANAVATDFLHVEMGRGITQIDGLEALRQHVMENPQPFTEKQLRLKLDGEDKTLLVRMVPQMSTGGRVRSIVVTFDDITEMMTAQKLSAWADVAQRIAHEIKNPLTPIQLSAERLQRRYAKTMTNPEDKELFEQLTATIVRQVDDMRQMVNEFSDFARMPAAKMQKEDLGRIISDVLFLQQEARSGIAFEHAFPEGVPLSIMADRSQISRVFTNIIENAINAIQERSDEKVTNHEIKVVVELTQDGKLVTTVKDNGPGLPKDVETDKLFDPYVTTRKKGTGLGLAIVKRVVDEHGGQIRLMRRKDTHGTCVEIVLPTHIEKQDDKKEK